jgi:hypothetical protein
MTLKMGKTKLGFFTFQNLFVSEPLKKMEIETLKTKKKT